MNITLVAFQDEKSDYDTINVASVRILYPETIEEAAIAYETLLLETEDTDQEEWEITVLLDGREADGDEQDEIVDRITNPGKLAREEAARRRREEQKRLAAEKAARQKREEEARKARVEEEERRTYARLRAKYGIDCLREERKADMKLLFTATPTPARDLQPGDLFSNAGPEYWSDIAPSIGERVYIRTDTPAEMSEDDPGVTVYRITPLRLIPREEFDSIPVYTWCWCWHHKQGKWIVAQKESRVWLVVGSDFEEDASFSYAVPIPKPESLENLIDGL